MNRAFDHVKSGGFSPAPWLEAPVPSLADATLPPPGADVMSVYVQYAPVALRDGTWDAARGPFMDAVFATLDRYMQIKVPVPLPQILEQFAAGRSNVYPARVICLRPGRLIMAKGNLCPAVVRGDGDLLYFLMIDASA